MQRLLYAVVLAIILIGLPLFVSSDTDTSTADAGIRGSEVTGSMNRAGNSSASATITITMYTGDG